MNFQNFWPPNRPDLNTVDYKIWGSKCTRQKAQDVNDVRRHLLFLCELECNRALLTMALTSGADVSMPVFELQEHIVNIHRDIS